MPSMAGMFSSIGPDRAAHFARAALDARACSALRGVAHAKRHGVDRGTVLAAKLRRLAARLHVQDEIDVALLVAQHVLGAVARHGREAHGLEQCAPAPADPGW